MANNTTYSETAYRCTYCRETKPGRFRRPEARRGWSQGLLLPVWICRDCEQAHDAEPKETHGEG